MGRLSLAETTGPEWGMRFSYDGFGSLTGETATKGTGFTTTYNHDANNRLIGGYAYDANGNLTSMPALTLTYDIENRLKQAVHTTNGTEQYVYSPWNERVWVKDRYGREFIHLYSPDGQLQVAQRVEIDTFAVMRLTGQTHELRLAGKLLHSGDREVIEDRIGTAKPKDYYPYGELKAGATASQFATYRRDASGLDYAINRYYASQVGRFTRPDPYMASGGASNPQSWNRYSYVLGDPVNYRDPRGTDSCRADATCVIVIGSAPSLSPLAELVLRELVPGWNPLFMNRAQSLGAQRAAQAAHRNPDARSKFGSVYQMKAFNAVLGLSDDCTKALGDHGIAQTDLANRSFSVTFLNGNWWNGSDPSQTQHSVLKNGNFTPINAFGSGDAYVPADRAGNLMSYVVLRSGYFANEEKNPSKAQAELVHEVMHVFTNKGDANLARQLGITDLQPSPAITEWLEKNCPD